MVFILEGWAKKVVAVFRRTVKQSLLRRDCGFALTFFSTFEQKWEKWKTSCVVSMNSKLCLIECKTVKSLKMTLDCGKRLAMLSSANWIFNVVVTVKLSFWPFATFFRKFGGSSILTLTAGALCSNLFSFVSAYTQLWARINQGFYI